MNLVPQIFSFSEVADESLYKKMVGSFLYLTATRHDFLFDASMVARYMYNPTRKHMKIVKKVLNLFKVHWIMELNVRTQVNYVDKIL